jgi:dephospho-CoA kinase
VFLLGLTGGIGSGKSSVSERLAACGAVIIDADAITRQLQEPGQAVFEAMVEQFGAGIVGDDGRLDRQAVADIVFVDPEAKARLEAIVHPAVGAEMAAQMGAVADSDAIVVLDVPLLVEKGRDDLLGLIVVDVDPEVAIRRLVEHRGFREDDARARIANQVDRESRVARADFVIDNGGDLAQLDAEVARCWEWIQDTAASAAKSQSSREEGR